MPTHSRSSRRLSRKPAGGPAGNGGERVDSMMPGPFGPIQAVAAARVWLWSFRRLWVAAIRRHSVRAADLPRR
jgi:hypothetical protein